MKILVPSRVVFQLFPFLHIFIFNFYTSSELRKAVVAQTDEKLGYTFLSGELNAAFIFREENGQFLMKMKSVFMKGNVQSHIMKEKLRKYLEKNVKM